MDNYKVLFSDEAMKDIEILTTYIKSTSYSPEKANKFHEELMSLIQSLNQMPNRHEIVNVKNIREDNIRRLIYDDYLIFYCVDDYKKVVHIISIVNGMQDWKTN